MDTQPRLTHHEPRDIDERKRTWIASRKIILEFEGANPFMAAMQARVEANEMFASIEKDRAFIAELIRHADEKSSSAKIRA